MFLSILDKVPGEIEIEDDGQGKEYRTSVAIATCDDTERVVSVDCYLSYVFGHEPPPTCPYFHEFSFTITVADLNEIELPHIMQDRNMAREYLPQNLIPLVMPIVLNSCERLIERVRPLIIYRVTKMRNPTTEALQKHNLITNLIDAKGYDVQESGTDSHSRAFWLHVRRHH